MLATSVHSRGKKKTVAPISPCRPAAGRHVVQGEDNTVQPEAAQRSN